MLEKCEKCQSVCNFVGLQPENIQFTVREEEINEKIFTFKKLESKNFDFFS